MCTFKLNELKFNLIILMFFLLNQVEKIHSQGSGHSSMNQQTIVGSNTTTGFQGSNNYTPNLIGTHVPIGAADPSSAIPAPQDSLVADAATATYADAIAGTTTSSTDDSSKSSANAASTKTADLAKVDVPDVINWLCAATTIVGEIPGCSKSDTKSLATPGTPSTPAPATTPNPSQSTAPGTTPPNTPAAPTTPGAPIIPGAPVLPKS